MAGDRVLVQAQEVDGSGADGSHHQEKRARDRCLASNTTGFRCFNGAAVSVERATELRITPKYIVNSRPKSLGGTQFDRYSHKIALPIEEFGSMLCGSVALFSVFGLR